MAAENRTKHAHTHTHARTGCSLAVCHVYIRMAQTHQLSFMFPLVHRAFVWQEKKSMTHFGRRVHIKSVCVFDWTISTSLEHQTQSEDRCGCTYLQYMQLMNIHEWEAGWLPSADSLASQFSHNLLPPAGALILRAFFEGLPHTITHIGKTFAHFLTCMCTYAICTFLILKICIWFFFSTSSCLYRPVSISLFHTSHFLLQHLWRKIIHKRKSTKRKRKITNKTCCWQSDMSWEFVWRCEGRSVCFESCTWSSSLQSWEHFEKSAHSRTHSDPHKCTIFGSMCNC